MQLDSKQVYVGSITPNTIQSTESMTIPDNRTVILVQKLDMQGKIFFNANSKMVWVI